eukprot:14492901-Heterocapsa_arctica.AAC.1
MGPPGSWVRFRAVPPLLSPPRPPLPTGRRSHLLLPPTTRPGFRCRPAWSPSAGWPMLSPI